MSLTQEAMIELKVQWCKDRSFLAIREAQKMIRDLEGGYLPIGEK